VARTGSFLKVLGRAVLGAVAGAFCALTALAVLGSALSHNPPDESTGMQLFLLGAGFGGTAGAILAIVAGSWQLRGWGRDLAFGVIGGCLAGILGAGIYAKVASGHSSDVLGKFTAEYRFVGLCVGVPTGALLGGIAGLLFHWGTRQR
jgi:hypothetical protein